MSMIALNPNTHQHLRVDPDNAVKVGADQHLIPVVVSEFQKLVVTYPIVLTKHAETGQFTCSVLTGFDEGENLFWQENQWQALSVPAQIERHPFFVGEETREDGQAHAVVCIDEASPALSQNEGEAIFDAEGHPTAFFNNKQQLLAQLLDGEQQTRAFIDVLLSYELITPITLDITFGDGSSKKVQGLFTIDEDKLTALPSDAIGSLHSQQWLPYIYTLIASNAQIYHLIDRKNKRIAQGNAWFG